MSMMCITIFIMFNNLYNNVCEDGLHVGSVNDTSRCRGFLYRLLCLLLKLSKGISQKVIALEVLWPFLAFGQVPQGNWRRLHETKTFSYPLTSFLFVFFSFLCFALYSITELQQKPK